MSPPTELERIISLELEFDNITNSNDLNKIIKNFKNEQTDKAYDYIILYLSTVIDLEFQNNNNSITNIYLINELGLMLASYINGQFSTFVEYQLGLNFATFSEEQEYLNRLTQLQTTGKANVNLLAEPIVNVIASYFENMSNPTTNNFLYYMVSELNKSKKINKNCEYDKYSLVGFVYKYIDNNPQ